MLPASSSLAVDGARTQPSVSGSGLRRARAAPATVVDHDGQEGQVRCAEPTELGVGGESAARTNGSGPARDLCTNSGGGVVSVATAQASKASGANVGEDDPHGELRQPAWRAQRLVAFQTRP